MEKLTTQEMKRIEGGVSLWVGIGIGALAIFLSGVLDGIIHPKRCEGGSNAVTQ